MEIPAGWTVEEVPGIGTVLTRPQAVGGGLVTIDMGKRAFSGGFGSVTRPASTMKYKGRDWQERIVADAVAWLDQVMS